VATLATEAAAAIAGGNLQEAAAFGALQALLPLAAFMTAFGLGWLLFRHRRGVPG
jgi:ABC-type uncharacterized transport system YnjBCD permease subunit